MAEMTPDLSALPSATAISPTDASPSATPQRLMWQPAIIFDFEAPDARVPLAQGWSLEVSEEAGLVLQAAQPNIATIIDAPLPADPWLVDVRTRWEAGQVSLLLFSEGQEFYRVTLDDQRQVRLYREGLLVAAGQVAPLPSITWQSLALRMEAGVLSAHVSSQEALRYEELAPRAMSQVGLSAQGMTRAQFDLLTIWEKGIAPPPELPPAPEEGLMFAPQAFALEEGGSGFVREWVYQYPGSIEGLQAALLPVELVNQRDAIANLGLPENVGFGGFVNDDYWLNYQGYLCGKCPLQFSLTSPTPIRSLTLTMQGQSYYYDGEIRLTLRIYDARPDLEGGQLIHESFHPFFSTTTISVPYMNHLVVRLEESPWDYYRSPRILRLQVETSERPAPTPTPTSTPTPTLTPTSTPRPNWSGIVLFYPEACSLTYGNAALAASGLGGAVPMAAAAPSAAIYDDADGSAAVSGSIEAGDTVGIHAKNTSGDMLLVKRIRTTGEILAGWVLAYALDLPACPDEGNNIPVHYQGGVATPTPTVTPNPTECQITLITSTQVGSLPYSEMKELLDMLLITSRGIMPLKAPTINAAKGFINPLTTEPTKPIEWGSVVTVFQRIEFPQTVINSSDIQVSDIQVWYAVYTQGGFAWVPVRYNGINYVTAPDPCLNSPFLPLALTSLTFPYDRRAAANYAIEHSYDTAVNHGVLQNTEKRVSQRISALQVPYAYFRYLGLGTTLPNGDPVTGSALFISESQWMGGMPMTWGGISTSCSSGWRYCFEQPTANPPIGSFTVPFSTHGDLHQYWTGVSGVLQPPLIGGVFATTSGQFTSVIVGRATSANNNPQIGPITLGTDLNPPGQEQLITFRTGIINSGKQGDLSARVISLLNQSQNGSLRMGDYITMLETGLSLLPPPNLPSHGLMVVGWQEALNCQDAIFQNASYVNQFRIWTVDQFAESYIQGSTIALDGTPITNPVPWVVDFTSPPNIFNEKIDTQNPVPRPFYCTMYRDFQQGVSSGEAVGDYFVAHDWQFFRLPEEVMVTTQSGALNRLYIDPDWGW